jgi:glucose/arabinose dehydrogenase
LDSMRTHLIAMSCAVAAATLLAGCAAGPLDSGSAGPGSTASGVAATAPAAAATEPAGPQAPASAAWPDVRLAAAATGLSQPLYATGASDGSGRLFLVEKTGRIRVLKDGVVLPDAFLDLSGRVSTGGEQGLLGLAFPPGFARTGRFYVDYTDAGGNTVVECYGASPGGDVAGPEPLRRILYVPQPYANHNGGCLQFGPDGSLYVGMGDGGSHGDPQDRAQDRSQLLGKILRIDPEAAFASGSPRPYLIPKGNPLSATVGARPEIWLLGLRNPWRFSFDPSTGRLWIGDVGQDAWEEIDAVAPSEGGANLGWNVWEGDRPYPPGTPAPSRAGFTFPVDEYAHPFGESVTGGYVYRGTRTPAWGGYYFFGDYVKGQLFALRYDGGPRGGWRRRTLLQTGMTVASFGRDDAGELYLCDLAGGAVYRLDAR